MDHKKIMCLAVLAFLIAVVAYSQSGIPGTNGVNGTNGINQSDTTKINKTDIGEASGGMLADARLSSNVILNNTAHTKVGSFTRDISLADGTQAITGVGFKPSAVIFLVGKISTNFMSVGFDDGTNSGRLFDLTGGNYYIDTAYSVGLYVSGGVDSNAKIVSLDSDGFTVTWLKEGAPTGVVTILYMAFR